MFKTIPLQWEHWGVRLRGAKGELGRGGEGGRRRVLGETVRGFVLLHRHLTS